MSQLMEEQEKSGLDVSAIVHKESKHYKEETEVWSHCRLFNVKSFGQIAYAPFAPSFPFVLRRALSDVKPDIIHIHMPNLSAFWLLLLAFTGPSASWIIHWHSDVVGTVPDLKVRLLYPFYRLYERRILKKAAAVICTSPNYLNTSEPLKDFHAKCHIIPLGINTAAQSLVNKELGSKHDTLKLICIGRLTYYKGHSLLFEAIKQLTLKGSKIILDVVGEGELREKLEAIVKHVELEGCIRFYGGVSEAEKLALLGNADVLCLPSIERTEAFGVVLLEAAAFSKPALVNNVFGSGMTYVVEKGRTGLVAEPNSLESLIEQLQWAVENTTELRTLGNAAKLRFMSLFQMTHVSQKITDVYNNI